MGVDDKDIDAMMGVLAPGSVNSLFGNSIVVDVLEGVFRNLFYGEEKQKDIKLF